ncbi:Holliday junction resolvase [Phaeobacter inhibens]|uniref:Holliday junction resolvase n=1 Tax=Phaeobacter inhibens TaxID=221822 RepID=A0ABM6RCA6_9RHOB|nr:RusA family crossover junction endodeoxyribonuclease [Phaeobacter inhibens]AUQ49448.1 Holliday junction resolvase [Phaeobacter inhibens]AUQ94003.1 Holliday junction resolvase [Phaeobacter inhibens]AUR19251.1 Holliday junction resolvase [Phaeobacter inhibens]
MFEADADEDDVSVSFPVEFVVRGTPVSLSNSGRSKNEWQSNVLNGARSVVPEHKWASSKPLSITIYDFPEESAKGDVDNIVKWIQDALKPGIILDDSQIVRVVAQRFLPADLTKLEKPGSEYPELVAKALALADPPFVFVRLNSNPLGEAQ